MVRNFIQTTESTEPKMLHERPGETPKHEIPPPPRIIVLSRSSPQILVICISNGTNACGGFNQFGKCMQHLPNWELRVASRNFIAINAMYASPCKQENSSHHRRSSRRMRSSKRSGGGNTHHAGSPHQQMHLHTRSYGTCNCLILLHPTCNKAQGL